MVVLRPGRGARITGCGLAAFGVIFGLSALAAKALALQMFMGLYGLFFMLVGISIIIARLTCDSTGLSYRTLRTVRVAGADVTTVTVHSIAGYAYRRLRIDIQTDRHRQNRRQATGVGDLAASDNQAPG